jgi:hypothetical protein
MDVRPRKAEDKSKLITNMIEPGEEYPELSDKVEYAAKVFPS